MVQQIELWSPRPAGAGDLPEAAFRLIVDASAVPFVVIDRLGTIRYAGGSVGYHFGWDCHELIGRNVVEFVPEDQLELALVSIAELDDVNAESIGVPIVFALEGPKGGRTWVEIGASPITGPDGLDLIALRLRPWEAEHHLSEFVAALVAAASLDDVLVPLARFIAAVLHAGGAAVHHGFDGTRFLGVAGSWPGASSLCLDHGPWCDLAASATTSGEIVAVDVDVDCIDAPRCWLVPILSEGDVAPAVVSIWHDVIEEPLIGHRATVARLSGHVELALVRTADHQRLLHLAGSDSLTGVANRASFRDRLAGALAIGERDLAVAFCDLDRFKPVNDTYGHRTGDGVLVEVVSRLRQVLRSGDELARIGGDEFTILLRNVPDAVTAAHVADRLLASIDRPFSVPGGEVTVGLSVGVAMAHTGATAEELLAAADAALYACKRAGGGRSAVVG